MRGAFPVDRVGAFRCFSKQFRNSPGKISILAVTPAEHMGGNGTGIAGHGKNRSSGPRIHFLREEFRSAQKMQIDEIRVYASPLSAEWIDEIEPVEAK